jgi:hypothetical protein
MRLIALTRGAAILAVCFFIGRPSPSQTPTSPKHLADALKLVKSIKLDRTSYRHNETSVLWKGDKGAKDSEAYTDCNGFLTSLLMHAYPKTAPDFFKKWLKQKPPMPENYFQAINQQKGFTKSSSIDDVYPGDIIAVKYPPEAQSTGHVMLVAGAPKRQTPSDPVVAGTEQWEVPVIDASMAGHGKADTRRLADGVYHAGLGMGSLRLYTKSGTVSGYSWSLLPNADFHDTKARPLVIGRVNMSAE